MNQVVAEYSTAPFLVGYRISPEEIETPGIRLADSLYFVDQIKEKISYLHLSMGSYQRTSLNDQTDNSRSLVSQFAQKTKGVVPLIGVGSVESPEDAAATLAEGADFVAIGRELIREPQWFQKVSAGEPVRTSLSPFDLDELAIPGAMQEYLQTAFRSVMHLEDGTDFDSYRAIWHYGRF